MTARCPDCGTSGKDRLSARCQRCHCGRIRHRGIPPFRFASRVAAIRSTKAAQAFLRKIEGEA